MSISVPSVPPGPCCFRIRFDLYLITPTQMLLARRPAKEESLNLC